MWWILGILAFWFFASRRWQKRRWKQMRNDPNWQAAMDHWQRGAIPNVEHAIFVLEPPLEHKNGMFDIGDCAAV
jgi:hypothetical protein